MSIHGMDPLIDSLDRAVKVIVIIAMNSGALFIDEDLSEEPLPQFLSSELTTCEHLTCDVHFTSPFIQDLAEVEEYISMQEEGQKRYEAQFGYCRYSAALTPPRAPKKPIPAGIWFPGTVESAGVAVDGAYKIREWRENHRAIVDCYLSQPITMKSDAILKRRVPRLGKETNLGRIVKVS